MSKAQHLHPLAVSDLPITGDRIYHLDITAQNMADKIILVGDPGRAELISQKFFKSVEFEWEHRGLFTATGIAKSTASRVSAVTSGMGTSSEEVVLNELFALHEIDLKYRERKGNEKPLQIIRVGTSGAMQPDTELGSAIITTYAVGLDNTGFAYDLPYPDNFSKELEERVDNALNSSIKSTSRFKNRWRSYVSKASDETVEKLTAACIKLNVPYKLGITVSNAGFFNNQGRWIGRIAPTVPDLDRIIAEIDTGDPNQRIENMEMEASFLHHFGAGNGYLTGTICIALANRHRNTFCADTSTAVANCIDAAILALG